MSENKSIRLILVRHGNTFESGQTPTQVGSQTDMPLTAQGRVQAQHMANYLNSKDIKPSAIYAGTLKRQIESAQIISKHFHMNDNVFLNEPALTEIDYGPWEGLTSEEISKQWPKEYENWIEQSQWADGIFGSSLKEHLDDIKKWIKKLNTTYSSGETVVGLTSNGIIRFFYSLQAEIWEKFKKERSMEDIKVKTGHFCELLLTKNSIEVIRWNINPNTSTK